jgi:tetratricopeptide (TPR) repeat protein
MDQGAAARQALRRGDWAAAQRLATGLLARSPAEGRFILGVAAAALGRVPEALAQVQQAVALDPRGEYRAQLAKLLSLLRRDAEAARFARG